MRYARALAASSILLLFGGCSAMQSVVNTATGPCARQTLTGVVLGSAGGYLATDAASSNGKVKAAGTIAAGAAGGAIGFALCQRARAQQADLEARFSSLEQSNADLRRRVALAEADSEPRTQIGGAPPSGDVPGGGYVEVGDVEVLQNRVVRFPIGGTLAFPSGSAEPSPQMRPVLDELAASLLDSPNSVVQIQGHTDAEGTRDTNLDLSQRRADAVVGYLTSRGVAPGRLEAVGFGEDEPVDTNATPEGRMRNRRIEVLIAPTQA